MSVMSLFSQGTPQSCSHLALFIVVLPESSIMIELSGLLAIDVKNLTVYNTF